MPNKKISQLPINTNPTFSDVFPIVNDGVTKQLSLTGLTDFIGLTVGQNKFSREINICEENLSGIGTIEEQIVEYLVSIEYTKTAFDGEVMIIVDSCGSGGSGGDNSFGIGLINLE
jgi:hypothetical protein